MLTCVSALPRAWTEGPSKSSCRSKSKEAAEAGNAVADEDGAGSAKVDDPTDEGRPRRR